MINVIIADDELLMRIGLKSMIDWEEQGFHIIGEAANGKEALDIARRHPPDLIITDIKMPVMDGLELIREASQFLDGCEYVILSCMDEFQYAKEALRLGAADYLIKSDIKQQHLLDVLDVVRKRLEKSSYYNGSTVSTEQYKEGIGYLKETLFKELFSGFRKEEEIISHSEALHISLVQGPIVLVKLKVDRFEDIRQKYVEQDEKLLRYAVVNIMEEIIPRKWKKELVIENSAEYLLVMNVPGSGESLPQEELNKLFEKILSAMKDFLNISFSIGVSSLTSGFGGLKNAYREADTALRKHFFEGESKIIYFTAAGTVSAKGQDSFTLNRDEELEFRSMVENGGAGVQAYMEELKLRLYSEGVTEQDIRKTYMRILSLITSCFPSTPEFPVGGYTPYEQLLREESLEGLHQLVLQFLQQCLEYNSLFSEKPQSYAELARSIIMKQYAEDISLQTVAGQINVNPSYLSRVFKQETGGNFVSFLTRTRIEKAQKYLKVKHYKVYEVADMVGYQNTAYFSKTFKKITGVTPEEYRG